MPIIKNKDWTGSRNSVFTTLGASNHTDKEREQNDYYATSPVAIDKLLAKFKLPKHIWECACGEGHLSKRLEELGHLVFSTDLIDRGYGRGGVDFLTQTQLPTPHCCILTNPPYKQAAEFVLHSLDLLSTGGVAAFFLKTTFLEGKRRHAEIFSVHPPKYLFQFSERVQCAKNADFERMKQGGGSAVSYVWFVWEKGCKEKTTVEWI